MNSIFSNALPGDNEDEHIYTLKELFNQNNNNENNENNNEPHRNYSSNQIIERRSMSPNNKYKEFNSKDFSDSNNRMMEYNNNYNRNRSDSKSSSKSRNRDRERSRSRERERDRERERESSSRKYSRSNSREYRRTHLRNEDYRKRYDKPKNTGRNYQKPYSKFCCVENGINKISTQFTVPEHLVSLLIGKNGENVKSIMHSTGANVTFCKEVSKFIFNFIYIV